MQKRMSNTQKKMVPVMIDGRKITADLASIAIGATTHHGRASCGTEVRSPRTAYVGDTVCVFPESKGNTAIAIGVAELELVSIDHLTKRGFTVTHPNMSTASA